MEILLSCVSRHGVHYANRALRFASAATEGKIKFSIVTVNYNGEKFLEETISSVVSQASSETELEYIVIDGGSTDGSLSIIDKYKSYISHFVSEKDKGPANALNKGFSFASGDVLAWINSDDRYFPGTFSRVAQALQRSPDSAFCFGRCPIIDEHGREIRFGITRFKEVFFPLSSQFAYRCLNYISQPAMFFRKNAFLQAGPFCEDMIAAWDYKFVLGLWRQGHAKFINGTPLACFRWHSESISGSNFSVQFKEEYEAVKEDAGTLHPATIVHFFVRWLIVGTYVLMSRRAARKSISGCSCG